MSAAAHGQLGETTAAQDSLRELLKSKPDFALTARDELGRWFDRELVEHLVDGLRKAGLEIAGGEGTAERFALRETPASPAPNN